MSDNPDDSRRKRQNKTKAQLIEELEQTEKNLFRKIKMLRDLQLSEQRLRDFSEASADWFWEMGPDLRFSEVSKQHGQISGIPLDDAIGLTHVELARADPDDELWARHIADLELRRPFRDFRYTYQVENGQTYHYSVSGVPVFAKNGEFLGFRGTGSNITAEVRAGRAAKQANEQLAEAIEVFPDGFVLYDNQDRLVMCNQKYRDIYAGHADLFVPGNKFEDMLREGVARGDFSDALGREEEWIQSRVHSHQNPTGEMIEQRLSNGAILLISERRTPEGSIVGIRRDITEQKKSQEALRKSEERYSIVLKGGRDAIWEWDINANTLEASAQVLEFLGYKEGEIDLTVEEWISRIHPDDVDLKFGTMRAYLTGATDIYSCEYRVRKKSGDYMWLLERGIALWDENGHAYRMAGSGSDITERKLVEESLRYNEERFHDFAESASDWYWEMDENFRFTYLSERLQKITGVDPETAIGKTRQELVNSPDDGDKWQSHQDDLENHRPFRDFHYRYTKPDGEVRDIKISGLPVFANDGCFKGYRGTGSDVTEILHGEAQVLQSNKLATLGQMAAGIAHEIAQPLNIIRMASEISLLEIDEGTQDVFKIREKFANIEKQVERMAEIIDHMRLFARQDRTSKRPFNPVASTANAVKLVQSQVKGLDLKIDCDFPRTCRDVFGSPLQLEQVVINLLTNAIDAVQEHAVRSGALKPMIQVEIVDKDDKDLVRIDISDNGGGIPPDLMKKLFDPYFTTKEEGKGTGLGLTISHSIVSDMDGQLYAVNIQDGSRFSIVLPVMEKVEQTAKNENTKQEQSPVTPTHGGFSILVVDDEPEATDSMSEYLELRDHTVYTALDGYEALEFISDNDVDVVITDLRMPNMNGYELMQKLKEIDSKLPVIVTTGHTSFGEDEEISAEGVIAVIKKPVSLTEIESILDGLKRKTTP